MHIGNDIRVVNYTSYSPDEIREMVKHAAPRIIFEIGRSINDQQLDFVVETLHNPCKIAMLNHARKLAEVSVDILSYSNDRYPK